ncbi:MAG: M20/M25/M40 family metallo-hydrolase [Pseudomonadota bacterium]
MKRWLGRLALACLVGAIALVAVLIWNTTQYTLEPPVDVALEQPLLRVDTDRVATKLGRALRHETVSGGDADNASFAPFRAFLAQIESDFPLVHSRLQRTLINELTPVYHWRGRDPNRAPILLIGHYDVVPVLEDTLDDWVESPFSGQVSAGHVWGRGALDNKGAVIAMLEAVELMLEAGVQPARSVWLAFGHDEEIGGRDGAQAVKAHFQANGVRFDWVLDEGSMVLDGIVPGLSKPLASINTAEKGYFSVDVVAKSEGGHSSLPTDELAVEILAEALLDIRDNPVPGFYDGITADFFDAIGPAMPYGQRIAFANRWLTSDVLARILSGANTTNAMLRTTTAPTMLTASPRENVLPSEVRATINFRVHPRDSLDGIVDHLITVIDDTRVRVEPDPRGF